jgi:RimJ/RimL family protein N-acetyltransferase
VNVDGYSVTRLTREDVPQLQAFLERCSGYYELCEGGPTPPNAAELELEELPPGYPRDDHFPFLVRDAAGEIVALVNFFRNYPREHQWWLGFHIVDPAHRNQGLGERLLRGAEEFMLADGAEVLQLAVSQYNPAGERFWRRMGFIEIERQPHTTVLKKQSVVLIMRKTLVLPGGPA